MMMEALMAIIISLVLGAGAVSMFGASERTMYKERVSIGLVDLASNIRKSFSTRGDYSGLTEDAVSDLGLYPNVLAGGGPDGSEITISPSSTGNTTFDIVLEFSDSDVAEMWCADLLPDGRGAWVGTGVNASNLESGMTVEEAADACGSAKTLIFRGM